MEQELIEYYHRTEQIPEWAYYQLSDKPIYQKYQEQKDKLYREICDKKMMEDINKQVEDEVNKALTKLFKDFSLH